jgi:hypothetical protein
MVVSKMRRDFTTKTPLPPYLPPGEEKVPLP